MYRIAILVNDPDFGGLLAQWTKRFCMEQGFIPTIELHEDTARFYQGLHSTNPDGVIVALPGVAGLNATERLRALCPGCKVIWCSDLDFSLQAYRLRAAYFTKAPVTNAELRQALALWFEQKRPTLTGNGADRIYPDKNRPLG